MRRLRHIAALALLITAPTIAEAQKTLRVVAHSDLKIIDPVWTTAYIVRNHGYMIYDTLFAQDAAGDIKPQMVGAYAISADQLTHTMTLRDGLLWHDGTPVTADDCVASIKRWWGKDPMGQKLQSFTESVTVKDARTLEIKLTTPTALVTQALGKPSSNTPFMMPKRVADTDPNKQLDDTTGSGPFIFKRDEWKAGDKVVYVKNTKYVPRNEPPSGLAGGKVVRIDRIEWRSIPDSLQAVNALLAGEIDQIELISFDLIPVVLKDKNVALFSWNKPGAALVFRPNVLHKPFDNPLIRQAVWYAFNQKDFLDANVGDPQYYTECKSIFVCGGTFASTAGVADKLSGNVAKAKALLKEAGYDGTPVVLMQATDLLSVRNLGPVAKQQLEAAGFKVDLQMMDWQTVVARRAKKDLPTAGGWNAFFTSMVAADAQHPIGNLYAAGTCDKAGPGWACDEMLEKLRDAFARETEPAKQKALAEAIQTRSAEVTSYIPLGQYMQIGAHRKNVKGWLEAPVPVWWNVEVE